MSHEPTEASVWRVELAKELADRYSSRPGVRMIVLGGSSSRGTADAYSDLDIVVYWDEIDVDWLESVPLGDLNCERKWMSRMGDADVYIESYYFGTLKVDFGHITMDLWKEEVDGVIEKFDSDSGAQQSLAGFMASIALHGEDEVAKWKERVSNYPDGLADRMLRENRRFYVPGYLVNQALDRGDIISYYDGLTRMLKNLLGLLAGLNRMYLSVDEPRWAEYYIEQMEIKPVDAWARMSSVLTNDGPDAVAVLDGLIDDVIELIAEHRPDIDLTRTRLGRTLAVEACESRPDIRRNE